MASYLEKFNSTIRKKQTEQILKLLNKQRSTGQIRTVEEFTSKLEKLVRDLTSAKITPTIKLFPAESKDVTSSETFNFMLERVEDDLTTGFAEAFNIDQVQKAHEAIVRDVLLKNLNHGIAELESKVGLYEFLQGDKNGFTSSIFSTFRESKDERTARSTANNVAALFTDPRTNQSTIPNTEDANVDLIGERLTLGFDAKDKFNPRTISQLFDSDTITSAEAVTRPGTTLNRMIDGTKYTYWVQAVLVKSGYTKLTTKLHFELPGTKTINFVEIEPANVYPFRLKKVFYYDSTNVVQELAAPNLLISGVTSFIFPTITASKIILEFESFTRRRINFQKTTGNKLIWQAIGNPQYSMGGIAAGMNNAQIPLSISQAAGIPIPVVGSFMGDTFEIGFDNIRFGRGVYSGKSIYVSKPLNVKDPLQVGLKVDERRPSATSLAAVPDMSSTTYDTDDNVFFHGSIEYWVIKRDFDKAGNIVATYKLPILPTGVERVHHERLVLTERSSSSVFLNDRGYLQFFAHPDVSEIKMYRNGVLMAGNEWSNTTNQIMRTPNTNTRMRTRLRVQNVLAGDIITVSYKPVLSSTVSIPDELTEYSSSGISIVDVAGNTSARVVQDQLLILSKGPTPEKVHRSSIYLAIVLRNNTSDTALTPAVEEYTLVIGEKDIQKFSSSAF